MSSSRFASAWVSRQVVVVSGVVLLAGALAAKTEMPGATKGPDAARTAPQAAQAPDPNPFVPLGDNSMILIFVSPDKTADFEEVMGKIKEGMAKPDKADDPAATPEAAKEAADLKTKRALWRKQAEGWSLLKVAEPNPNKSLTYIWVLHPAQANTVYDPTDILYSSFERADADVLFAKLKTAMAGVNRWTVTKLMDMK